MLCEDAKQQFVRMMCRLDHLLCRSLRNKSGELSTTFEVGILQLVTVVRVTAAMNAVQASGPVFRQSPLASIKLSVLEDSELFASVPAPQPGDPGPDTKSSKGPTKTSKRSGKERTKDAVVSDVETFGKADKLDTLCSAVIEDSAKEEHRKEATDGASDSVDAVEEVQLGDKTKEERGNAGNGGKVGNEEDFQDVDVLDSQHDRRHVDEDEDASAPPNVESSKENIVLNRRDLGRLESVICRRAETATQNNDNTGQPVRKSVENVEERQATIVGCSRSVKETRPPSERAGHSNEEADGK